ncbi:cyclic nucleotide-binding domain protein (macronuclear) [Tetrahymena thermophila SB210]|uniref:Cyclic nucleotide-binding domain protein n=1 Tax=Tetrahymena thermophila (strain SB210) TaxID=312017 RepID=X1W3S5_TETTS|nr:cyclic nucleotide-binding domain protein [Tetrahymena thermophila SB210]EAS01462.3 cyclic nucleotide-binding domain protein [Tetrahymena thermophila SB210]|eukprot:XP_001021708.3 cyclic nucleotide-binding domain protein [Tetrahymena thermophila SB210]
MQKHQIKEQIKASFNSHNSQGRIFRKSQDEMIDDDWMKFQGLNLRKEDSFQIEPDLIQEQGVSESIKNGKSQILKAVGDNSNKFSLIGQQTGYLEESQTKNMLNPDDIQIQTPHYMDTNNYKSYEKLGVSQQQIPLTSLSAGLTRKQQSKMTQFNKPSLNLISTSAADIVNKDRNSNHNNTNIKLLGQSNNLNLIMNIRKRIFNYINYYTYFGRKNFLQNELVRKAINDQSDFGFDQIDAKPCCLGFHKLLSCIRRHKCFRYLKNFQFEPLSPHTTFYLIWKLYVTLYNYLFFIVLSLLIVFDAGLNNQQIQEIYFNITAFQWCLEIFIKINTALYIKTKFINKRQEICKIYFQKYFLFDIIPLILILTPQVKDASISYIAIRLLLFIKYVNSYRDSEEAQKQLLMRLRHFYVVSLINLIVNLFLVGHILSCLWYLMSIIQKNLLDSDQSWFNKEESREGTWWKMYLSSYYWSFTLMATGSNEATTTVEIFFTCVVMIFTTIIFGYIVNTIGIILSEMNKLEEEQRKDINLINTYMKRKCISKKLQLKINLDLEQYYLRNTKNKSEEENRVLTKISADLNDEIKLEYYKNILQKVPFLIGNFQKETIDKLCLSIEEVFYSPNQIIFNEQESNDFSLIVIVSGQVDLLKGVRAQLNQGQQIKEEIEEEQQFTNPQQTQRKLICNNENYKVISTLKKGCTFGEVNFFTQTQRECTAKSRTFTTILKIERNNFLSIIQNNQKDFEVFCEMKDKIQMYNNYKIINKSCILCQNSFHSEQSCSQAHFNKNSPFIFSRINKKQFQERSFYKRKLAKSDNSYLIRILAQNCIDTLKQQYDVSEENKRKSLAEELPIQFCNMSLDYENDDEDDYFDNEQNYEEKFSPGVSPILAKEESQNNGYYSQNNLQALPLFMIPEENTRQRTVESTSELPSFQNANSLVYINHGSSNNIESGFQNFQQKQSIRFQSNGHLNSQSLKKEDSYQKELTQQQQKTIDNIDESQKQIFNTRENQYNQFRENLEHRKTILINNSPRSTRKMKSFVQRRTTILQNNDQMNTSINSPYRDTNQQKKQSLLQIQTSQQAQMIQNLLQGEKLQNQIERGPEKQTTYFRNENWNEKTIPLEEKNKNDFLFLFDCLKLFNHYFVQGNANIMISKWSHQRKKYLKKYASGEAKITGIRINKSALSYKLKSSNMISSPNQFNQRGQQSPFKEKK